MAPAWLESRPGALAGTFREASLWLPVPHSGGDWAKGPVEPARRAWPCLHSHNDYRRKRPLLDALDAGCASVEVDLHAHKGRLVVSHGSAGLGRKPEFSGLYLEPLAERIAAHAGRVYPDDGHSLTLLLDYKTPASVTHPLVLQALAPHAALLTAFGPEGAERGAPLRVLISGLRPELPEDGSWRPVALDGRWVDRAGPSPSRVPRISEPWGAHIAWSGKGAPPREAMERLRSMAAEAHQHGRRLRFWGAPDRPATWKALMEAEVDWINTDHPLRVARFLEREANRPDSATR